MKGQSSIFRNQNGVSIIVAVFILVVLGFMGVMMLSLSTTGSFSSLNDLSAAQALAVAEGGLEFARLNLALDNNWYWNPDPRSFTRSLSSGQFTAEINYPATALRKNIGSGAALPGGLPVFSVGNFAAAGFLYIEGEVMAYTGVVAGPPASFTGITRSMWGTGSSTHGIGIPVYPVTRLNGLVCSTPPCSNVTLTVGNTSKFLSRGTLTLNPDDPLGDCGGGFGGRREEVDYASLTATTFTGVDLNCTHPNNELVTPVLTVDQAGITSTGSIGSSERQVRSIVER